MTFRMITALGAALALSAAAGCDDARPACTPGASSRCACPDGREGAQSCGEDGRWSACACTGPLLDAGGFGFDAGPLPPGVDGGPRRDAGPPPVGVDAGPGGACVEGESRCFDAQSYQVCGATNPRGSASLDWGPRVPCAAGNACSSGECTTSACVIPEVLFIVDRSSSFSPQQWATVRDGLLAVDAHYRGTGGKEQPNRLRRGVRTFPHSSSCGAGPLPTLVRDSGRIIDSFGGVASTAQTPIFDALQVQPAFADPNQAQVAVLITDGDETCDLGASHRQVVSNLAYWGIRTHAIGVGVGANPALLADIASAGRTGTAHTIDTQAQLETVLRGIIDALVVCP